jgi:sn-glycerol 3-phosphate transport system permease protein
MKIKRKLLPYLLLIPTFLIIVVFIYVPAFNAFKLSLYKTTPFGNRQVFVGLKNFEQLFSNPAYHEAVRFTIIYIICSVGITIFLSFLMALLLTKELPGTKIYRTCLFAPYAISPAIAGTLWTFLLSPVVGFLNYAFVEMFGIQVDWLTSKPYAFFALLFATIWKMMPFDMIFYIGSIQSVPADLLEAATLDGAGSFKKTFKIIFPLVSPITFYLVIMNIVTTMFSSFAMIDVMTKGGPGSYTTNMIYKVYLDAFEFHKNGPAAAQSVILFFVMIVVTLIYFKFAERKVHYQ